VPAAPPISIGIASIVAGMFCLTLSDAMAKYLGGVYTPVQILFLRALIALPVVLFLTRSLGGRRALRTAHLPIHLLRGAINTVSASCFYLGLRHLPLADNTAIAFAAPLCVTTLSVWWFKEKVDVLRWASLCVGFGGVLIVVRPGSSSFQLAALYPAVTAMLYAVMMLSARAIGQGEGMLTTMFYIVAGQLVCSAVLVPWFWRAPEWAHLPYFLGIAACSTLGLTLITQAFRSAPACVIAPFDYTGLVWAMLLGWLFWDETPQPLAYLGMACIVLSGLYIIWRENRTRPA